MCKEVGNMAGTMKVQWGELLIPLGGIGEQRWLATSCSRQHGSVGVCLSGEVLCALCALNETL